MSKRRNKKSRQSVIYQIALAGISAAIALLMVWLGVVVKFSTIAFFVAASIAIMVPFANRYWISSVAAYAVSAGLSVLVCGDIFSVIGYVLYFGPMALITAFCCTHSQKIKWWLALIFKVCYINGALALLYYVFGTIMINEAVIGEIPYYAVAIVGTVGLVGIDFVLQMVFKKLIPLVERALRKVGAHDSKQDAPPQEDDEDQPPQGESPFEDLQ